MDKKFNLSSFKGKVDSTVFLVLFLVLLAALLGVASYFTVKTSMETSDKIKSVNEELEDNYVLIGRLRELKKNSDYYLKQKAEYDKVIADAGTYNSVDYYVELDSLCRKYDLKIEEIKVGEPGAAGGNVNSASTTLSVTGDEVNVRRMAAYIVSQQEIARIDDIAIVGNGDGTVSAQMTIVNFTK